MTLLIVNVEFFFRYMLICLVLYTLSGLGGSFALLALLDTSDQVATFGHLMSDPIWFDKYGKQAIFVGATRTNVFALLYLACSGLNNILLCGASFWLGIATYRTLKQSRHTMSVSTKALNSQMNMLLILQGASVLFVINVPVGCLTSALLFDVNIVGLGIIMTMILVWIPVLNPIVTILLVGPYRREVFRWIKRFRIKRRVTDTQHDSSQNPRIENNR
ncbi:serpentine type 7TM GPCR chemoreceptor str domain-containing protein [Ditylenchus destructor]|uniref:Serpentine type 7TM GPCR chemoreceptor str domain-containing protein n=1 Tax=Ditylenchus destructor TaxID=166010 RepID=A0AAD4MPL7_9BILA|nr:serpentine type 7TM GPCR chemoreceptor str domain-containing protein [Ditylenchus destructor]